MLLGIVEVGNRMQRFHLRGVGGQVAEEVFHFILRKLVVFLIPFLCRTEAFAIFVFHPFHFIAELVVEVFVEKHLDDDFIFVTVVTQSVGTAGLFQTVNKLFGSLFYICCVHYLDSIVFAEIF